MSFDHPQQLAAEMAAMLAAPIDAALREFDGTEWDRLAQRLTGLSEWSGSVTVRTLDDHLVLTDRAIAELNPSRVWWSDWLRARATLFAALYFTCSVTAEQLWPDLVANLRDNAIAAIALYGAYVAWSKHQGR